MMAAGHLARARLSKGPDGLAMVNVGGAEPQPVVPSSLFSSFSAARHEPIFCGATLDGAVVAVMCYVGAMAHVKAFTHHIVGVTVRRVVAASRLAVLCVCRNNCVWLLDLTKPAGAAQVGRVRLGANPVAAFASPTIAVVVAWHASKILRLVVIGTDMAAQATWGRSHPETPLSPPQWATCCTCYENSGIITAFVGGTRIVAAQQKARLAGTPQSRSRIIVTSRTSPATAISVTYDGVLLLLANGRLVQLTEAEGKRVSTVGIRSALTDTGHTV